MVEMRIKLSAKQAGKLYQKTMRLEDEVKELKALLKEADEYLDTNSFTNIGHKSILHTKFKEAAL